MASLIAREMAPASYVSPACMLYVTEEGPYRRLCEEGSSDEEEEEEERERERKASQVSAVSRATSRSVAGGGRKISTDSAYSSVDVRRRERGGEGERGGERGGERREGREERGGERVGRMERDDCASTASSSVPLDPATQVAVFVHPKELEFVASGDSSDMRRNFTLYNPYNYPFQFKILCTAPEYYEFHQSAGLVGSRKQVCISIRAFPSVVPPMQHKFKVEIRHVGQSKLLGYEVVSMKCVHFPTAPPSAAAAAVQGGEGRGGGGRGEMRVVNEPAAPAAAAAPPVNLSLVLVVSLLCLLALCLPIQRDPTPSSESLIPRSFHISETQRVVAAFILGVCSVLILQPANNR